MNAVNAVLVLILLWTSSAVCQAEFDSCSVTCENVIGTVGEKVTFTCSVSQNSAECYIIEYVLQEPESYNNSTTCKQELPDRFTCSLTPTTGIKEEEFKFFVQTRSGTYYPTLSVNIEAPSLGKADKSVDTGSKDTGSKNAVIMPVVGLSVILILVIILTTIIYKKPSFRDQFRCPDNVV